MDGATVPKIYIHITHNQVTPNMTEAFLYQLSIGFSPLIVLVSSTYAHLLRNSSWLMTLVSFPVMA